MPNGFPFPGEDGTVFEIKKTAGGYASTPTTLVSFNGHERRVSKRSLHRRRRRRPVRHDRGVNGAGTVFEIKKTAAGYASTPTTLVSFNGANGASPAAGLIADASGDLFGTTIGGRAQR